MTAPMPETMSPREKVALKPCPFCGGEAWLNDYEAKYSDLPPKSRNPQCKSCGASLGYLTTPAKATEAWNRRAALASSGDHAELARLAERCTTGDPWYKEGDLCGRQTFEQFLPQDRAFIAAANPATVLALLAENAALRGRNEAADRIIAQQSACADEQTARATEAERKLAEAEGLNDRAADLMRQCTDPERFEGASTLNVYANMRAWLSDLSKEAERG